MKVSPPATITCTFDWEAQERFARFSGDRNPMHMDPVAARRTQAHKPVVHGLHPVLWALEALAQRGNLHKSITQVKVHFKKVIYVGEEVTLEFIREESAEARLQLCVDGLGVTSVDIVFGSAMSEMVAQNDPSTMSLSDWPEVPNNLSLAQLEHACGRLALDRNFETSTSSFPALSGVIGPRRVAALGCMSRLVGMVCPGLQSMFFGLTVNLVQSSDAVDTVRYKVTNVNESLRLVTQSVEGGGWSATIRCLALHPPIAQPALEHLAGLVHPGEFRWTNALIIGGSRGLGELTAKLIAAGGGAVTITYAVGHADALQVQQQIRDWGGACEILQYDATMPAKGQRIPFGSIPTSLYYFASESIFVRRTRLYSPALYEQFHRVYVDGFYDVCNSLLRNAQSGLSVFYPSSIAVENRTSDMTEYAMAKAAGEVLCDDLARSDKRLRLLVERLPRMLTDQTATVIPIETIAPLQVMLPIVRRMEASTTS